MEFRSGDWAGPLCTTWLTSLCAMESVLRLVETLSEQKETCFLLSCDSFVHRTSAQFQPCWSTPRSSHNHCKGTQRQCFWPCQRFYKTLCEKISWSELQCQKGEMKQVEQHTVHRPRHSGESLRDLCLPRILNQVTDELSKSFLPKYLEQTAPRHECSWITHMFAYVVEHMSKIIDHSQRRLILFFEHKCHLSHIS